MRFPFSLTAVVRLTLALVVAVGSAVLLSSSDTPVFTANDKAYYADQNLVNFVRPGLVLKILAASIDPDGAIKTRFRLTDPRGLPLDREGIATPGAVSVSVIAAHIPQGQTQYVAYTTRQATSPITKVTMTQAGTDSGGTFDKVAEGEYIYTLKTKAPANFDKTASHSIGIYAGRNLAEFDLASIANYDDEVYTWVPDGSKVTVTRDVIKTATCNKCHDPLSLHGNRRSMELCVLCHTPQTADPDTGNTVDMPVMTHKIHMGHNLPSVLAGGKYQIIGYQQSVHDYSTVAFPSDRNNCAVCHEQNTGAAQATAHLTPSRAACGACHDNVNFATGRNHANLPQVSDRQCGTCHVPQGELEYDLSIVGAHNTARFSRDLPGVVFEILRVTDDTAGKKPVVTFSIKERSGKVIPISGMTRIGLVLSGPTTDYGIYAAEDGLRSPCAADGTCTYTFTAAIPATAKGTYTIGIEGYRNLTLMAGTKKELVVRDAAVNKQASFAVDGSKLEPRRTVVSLDKCNKCHFSLALHGFNRNKIEECVLCHNPITTDVAVRPAAQMPAQSIDMRYMAHRIHTGEENQREYTVYGRGSTAYDFTEVRYPGDRRNCSACHVNGSENLPLKTNVVPVVSPRGLLNPMGPITAACTGCHTSMAAASHALSNTTEKLGEACETCHGANSEFSVSRVHAR